MSVGSRRVRRWTTNPSIAAVVSLGLFGLAAALHAQDETGLQPLPPLLRQISDAVGVMSIDEGRALSSLLAAIEEKKRTKIIVVIMPTVTPEGIEDYTKRLMDRWLSSGRILENERFVFIAIAKEDRAIRVLPSRSLSRVLAPLQSSETMRQVPGLLRQDRYYEALTAIAKKLSELTAERSV